ncbi:YcjF family protein [Rubrobacter calidifluminis]|uniref:YcjF family protein n=1 Tax=Rubrobacter calidifluminis TaxID=1392640 RepID=UPI0023614434|nr:DUF697 domain-containing protein [Rubrobacter calidifluminis]
MYGLRHIYRAWGESRRAARGEVRLGVLGDEEAAARVAGAIGAGRSGRGAGVVISVDRDGAVVISGPAVEREQRFLLSSLSEESVRRELVPRVARAVGDDHLVSLGRSYPGLRRAVCEEIVHKNARQNAVVGAIPVPGADMPVMTANQARMVLMIAAVHGEELSLQRARELAGVLAAGFGLRSLARQAVKLVPVGGWAAAGTIGYAGTLAMGRAAILYFERGKRQPSERERDEIWRRARREAEEISARLRRR